MKKQRFAICLIISSAFFACTKPSPLCCVLPQSVGVYAQKDSKTWVARSVTDTSQLNVITVYAKTDSDALKFKFTRTTNTVYALEVPQKYEATYYVTKGAHGSLTYVLDNAATNDIKVAYGTGEKAGGVPNTWISGNFNITFKLATPTGNAAFDEKRVSFFNGTIHYGLQN